MGLAWIDTDDYITTADGSMYFRKCPYCGAKVLDDDYHNYCPNCGNRVYMQYEINGAE